LPRSGRGQTASTVLGVSYLTVFEKDLDAMAAVIDALA
jgi:hypothetical protein